MEKQKEHSAPVELLTKYLAKKAGQEEISAIETWINAGQENKREFEAMEKLWNYSGSEALKEKIDIDAEWNYLERKIGLTKGRTLSIQRILSIAAVIILIISLSIPGIKKIRSTTEKTSNIQVSELVLPDGTIVTLNANSKLTYAPDFNAKHRKLSLQGEAFFEVKPNKNLPFIIQAGNAQIEVVGTKFNVKARKNTDIKVTVTEGLVNFSSAKKPESKTLLKAGETGILLKNEQEVQKTPVSSENDYSWKTKLIVFENTTLKNALEIIANSYHVEFETGKEVEECAVTVTFDNQELPEVLKVLQRTLNLKIQVSNNTILITGDGCTPEPQ